MNTEQQRCSSIPELYGLLPTGSIKLISQEFISSQTLTPAEVLTETEVAEAQAELQALERHAVEAATPVASE